jgi:predicted house-cleaning noncanonical NTP pyrophosphatase (MazG superfamily)
MQYEELKSRIHSCLQNKKGRRLCNIFERRHGSAAGLPFEEWVKEVLSDKRDSNCGFNAYLQEDFISFIVERLREDLGKSNEEIRKIIRNKTWWGIEDYVISDNQLNDALKKKAPRIYQGSMADIIVYYGKDKLQPSDYLDDINNVLLINVKSHDEEKPSRPPNIISALRLLKFGRDLLRRGRDFLEKANLLFLGIYYKEVENEVENKNKCVVITDIQIRDLFKLNVDRMPSINFDAAIQIQWHIRDMIEDEHMDKLTFLEKLAEKYQREWREFMRYRTNEMEEIVNEVINLITKLRSNR